MRSTRTSDSLFEPTWAGGWTATRILWVVAAALAHVPRMTGIGDVYGATDFIITSSTFPINDWILVTPSLAWAGWGLGLLGLVLVAWGGRVTHLGLFCWAFGSWFLVFNEGANIKAYDRLLTWMALALLVSPAWKRGLAQRYCSPYSRYLLLTVFIAIYGSTGMCKLLHEPSWLGSGSVLAYHLVDTSFGMQPLGVVLSGVPWIMAPLAWMTVAFEVTFPFGVWFRKFNPWLLAVGASFHLGLMITMDVGPFGWVSLAAYPVLLHPEVAREIWERVSARLPTALTRKSAL
ncbi:MAG: HTTM domain-containing protein [Myxococcota bacterium]